MKRVILGLVVVMLASGCTAEAFAEVADAVGVVDVPEAPKPGDALTLDVDASLDRAAVEAALEEWRVASGGMINVHVGSPGDAVLVPGPESSLSRMKRTMILKEGMSARDQKWVTASLVGQMFGMETHAGAGALGENEVTLPLTEADLRSCRDAGWCP